jgi:uncharacterized protein
MMNELKNLSKSAQSVQDALLQKGLAFEVMELSSSTRTANDAAACVFRSNVNIDSGPS